MRLLFILENYHPHVGGVEIVFKNLCEGLAAKGHRVDVVTHRVKGTRKEEMVNGVRVHRVACAGSRYLFTIFSVPAALRYAQSADVIHTTTFNGAPPAWLASVVRNKPVLITVHETWIGKWREYTDMPGWKADAHDLLERTIFALAYDKYVCVSASTAERLRQVLPQRKHRITFIHNGFDERMWVGKADLQRAAQHRKRLRLEDKFVIFGYGRPGPSKGFEYMIKAFPEVQRRIKNAVLVLMLSRDAQYAAGLHRLRDLAEDLAPRDIIFLPPQKYSELPSFVKMADCVVVPSLSEGFGYTTLEACTAGVPVVASNTTSIPEVICGKHVLVKPKSSKAIAEGVIAVSAGKYTETPQKHFPWQRAVVEYEKIYKQLVRKRV